MAGHGLEYIPSGADGWQLQRDRAWRWDKVLGRRAGAELIGVIHMARGPAAAPGLRRPSPEVDQFISYRASE